MIPTLYKTFQHWAENGSVYILSDTHFDDPDTKIMDPTWITPEEQIKRINEVVRKNDTFICLGDVGKAEYISQIKASKKTLLLGNHDRKADYVDYFDEIYSGPLFIAEKILLSHEPVYGLPFVTNIHGHDHNNREKYREDCRHLNLAANVCDFRPVSLGKLIKEGILSGVHSIHRMTIDRAVQKKFEIPMPKLAIANWKWVAIDGLPTEDWWCLIMWRNHKGKMNVHVGSYYEKDKQFYVNFGLGGSVLEQDSVVGWVSFDDLKWNVPNPENIPLPEHMTREVELEFYLCIELDENRMKEDRLDVGEKWSLLTYMAENMGGFEELDQGLFQVMNSDTRNKFLEELFELPWFLKYVTRCETMDRGNIDVIVDRLKELVNGANKED